MELAMVGFRKNALFFSVLTLLAGCAAGSAPERQIAASEPAATSASCLDQSIDRQIVATGITPASIERVWEAWTTNEGVTSFFAPAANIEPRVGGAYEIFFDPSAPAGRRGAEGMRILAFDPPRLLSFTWNATPALPRLRAQQTSVSVHLEALGPEQTRVTLIHGGFGHAEDWDSSYQYFCGAWTSYVLPHLQSRFAIGPYDWTTATPTRQDVGQ
jgi:uncharacterized protein YndB with AHSA1/START domain